QKMLTSYPERVVSVGHVRIDRNHAPEDFIDSRSETRQRDVQQRAIRAIQMHIVFVHLFPGRIEHLNAAEGWFDVFCKSDSHLVRRRLNRAPHSRFALLKKRMRSNSRP